MKIKFLGTAAYEGIPSPFCMCDVCERTRKLGKRNIRTRTQALINDDLLIDFNADTFIHFLQYGIDTNKIDNVLITHSHSDHFNPHDMIVTQYSSKPKKVDFYLAKKGYDQLTALMSISPNMEDGRVSPHLIKEFEQFECGGYKVLPLKADHDPNSSPVFFAIEKDSKRLLYAHDTGLFPEENYEKLKEFGRFDFVTIDNTYSFMEGKSWYSIGHMNYQTCEKVLNRLKSDGVVDDKTIIVLNHFSHNSLATYDDLVELSKDKGVLVSYDGMEIEF